MSEKEKEKKKKFNFASSQVEDVGVWLGSFMLAGLTLSGLYILIAKINKPEEFSKEMASISAKDSEVRGNAPDFSKLKDNFASALKSQPNLIDRPLTRVPNSLDEGWDYKSQGNRGPLRWGGLKATFKSCASGKLQSPIDIRSAKVSESLQPLKLDYPEISEFLYFNDGRVPRLSAEEESGGKVRFESRDFALRYIDLHFPSEHLIEGLKLDAEIQLVHESTAGHILVIAILAQEKLRGSTSLSPLLADIPESFKLPPQKRSFSVRDLLSSKSRYFRYTGSLSHPPCQEDVTWLVLKDRLAISADWTDEFVKKVGYNARPKQASKGRVILTNK